MKAVTSTTIILNGGWQGQPKAAPGRRLDGALEVSQLLTGTGDDNLVIDIEDDIRGRVGEQITVLLLDGENIGVATDLSPLP